jgi:putative ABC transport system permease protein
VTRFPTVGGAYLIGQASILGPLWANKGRMLLSVLGIALGVALGVAVNLINGRAVDEFSLAVQSISGDADLVVGGPSAGFPEDLYPVVARLPEVEVASPAVELDAKVQGRKEPLKVVGIDPFRAARMQTALVAGNAADNLKLLASDAVFLSPAAAAWLQLRPGDSLPLQMGLKLLRLKVAGQLPAEGYRQRLAVMDIAAAQWRFGQIGRLNRIDIRLRPGTDIGRFRARLQAMLPSGVAVEPPGAEGEKAAHLSRAYRVNLNVLALVALFTGAFLVFATQALSVLRRRAQLALLRVLGLTRTGLLILLIGEGAIVGAAGAGLGVVLGYHTATLALRRLGGDLGGGYFPGIVAAPATDPKALAGFFLLGVLTAVLGALAPALEGVRAAPATALKAGDQERALAKTRWPWLALGLVALGLALTAAPPVGELPLFGYLAIALILVGAVLFMPALASALFAFLPTPRSAPAQVATAQLRGAPGHAAVSMAAILVSFSLMVAMAIMVASFRQSVDDWLSQVLPADLYVRAAVAGDTAFIGPEEQALIAGTPGVKRADFQRNQEILLAPDLPNVVLIARPVDEQSAPHLLPLRGYGRVRIHGLPPAWVSEAVSDVYGFRPGQRIRLPIGGREVAFAVAGIWRDYARQAGAIVIDRHLYVKLTGDRRANSAALWLEPDAAPREVARALQERLPRGAQFEIATPGEIRAVSLSIFDRSFAVTYLLEAVAVVIGLFGISSSFSAQVLARRGEFGMLRHIGMTRGQIGAMLGIEGGILGTLGIAAGIVLGWGLSLILIHVVNRQSFHWSMDLHIPWILLAALALLLVCSAVATAALSGRQAMGKDVIGAVREDW